MTKLLHFGDLHLGQGTDLADNRLQDQDNVLDEIVVVAVEHGVDAIVNGGDTFEGPDIWPAQESVYAEFVAKCRDRGIPIVQALGNGRHDLAKHDRNALAIFEHIPGVTVYDRPGIEMIRDTAICVLPWTPIDRIVAARDGGDRGEIMADAADYLLSAARGLADQADRQSARHKVLVPHWSISGAALPNGLAIDTHAVEPILPLTALEDIGFDVILAAHIHRAQLLGSIFNGEVVPEPNVAFYNFPALYAGSPMPLNYGETAYPHGVWIIDLDADDGVAATFVPIASRPLVTIDVDLTADDAFDRYDGNLCDETDVMVAAIAEHLPLTDAVVRLRYRATEDQARRIDLPAIRRMLDDAGIHKLAQVNPDIVRGSRARIEVDAGDLDPVAALDLWMDANDIDDGMRDRVRAHTNQMLQEVGQ